MENRYKSKRFVDRLKWVIVDEDGKIVNRNPSKEELKGLDREQKDNYKRNVENYKRNHYTKEELLDILRNYPKENDGKIPTYMDFQGDIRYPGFSTYIRHFGSWPNALKLAGFDVEPMVKRYTEKELLDFFPMYVNEYNEIPTARDFDNTPGYPSCRTYQRKFGSWSNALKLVELDVDSMVKKGIVETIDQKRRFGEMIIRDHFEENPIDLAGGNKQSPWDGVCPNGMNYDVKSSGFDGSQWPFNVNNKYKIEIKIYYLLAFNRNYTELIHAWRVPGLIAIDKSNVYVGTSNMSEFNVDNMKEYIITDKVKEVLNKYGYFEKIRNYRKARDKGMTI